jgi:AraC family transcriptional regulator
VTLERFGDFPHEPAEGAFRARAKFLRVQMQFSIIASSTGRRWEGFEASLYDISAGVSERPPNASHAMVLHLSSPVEGTCRCEDRFVRRLIKPGDIDFVPLGFAATWHDKGPGRVVRANLTPELLRRTAISMGCRDIRSVSLPSLLSLKDPILQHLMLAVVAELENGGDEPLFAESLATALATHLLRRYRGVRSAARAPGLSRRQLTRVLEYIDTNLATSLSHADIAAVAGIGPSRLKVLFKRSFGASVHQYVIRRRIDYAVRLLAERGARVCDVAQQAGFSDQSHMARFMRRVIGTTPAALLRDLYR